MEKSSIMNIVDEVTFGRIITIAYPKRGYGEDETFKMHLPPRRVVLSLIKDKKRNSPFLIDTDLETKTILEKLKITEDEWCQNPISRYYVNEIMEFFSAYWVEGNKELLKDTLTHKDSTDSVLFNIFRDLYRNSGIIIPE